MRLEPQTLKRNVATCGTRAARTMLFSPTNGNVARSMLPSSYTSEERDPESERKLKRQLGEIEVRTNKCVILFSVVS